MNIYQATAISSGAENQNYYMMQQVGVINE